MQKLRDKQKAAVKAEIMRAGEELFRGKGIAETTIEEIAKKAGVARGTFYNYFSSKEDLVLAIVYETKGLSSQEIEEFFASIKGTEKQIQAILRQTVDWTMKSPELVWISTLEKMKRGAIPQHHQGTFFRHMLIEVFERGQKAGDITTKRKPQELANDVEGLYVLHMIRWYHSEGQLNLLEMLQKAVDTYLHGAMEICESK